MVKSRLVFVECWYIAKVMHVASPHILDNKVYTKINILIRAYDVIAPQNYYACGTHTCMDMLMHACD